VESLDKDISLLKKRWWDFIVSIVVTSILLGYLFTFVRIDQFSTAWSRVSVRFLLLSFASYIFFQMFRALRFRALIDFRKTNMPGIFFLMCVHGLVNRMMPLWGGEISFVYLLRRVTGINFSEGTAVLLLARGIELFVNAAVLLTIVFFPMKGLPLSAPLISSILFVLGVGCVVLATAPIFWAEDMLTFISKRESWLGRQFYRLLLPIGFSFRDAHLSGSKGKYLKCVFVCSIWSVFMWISMFLFLYFLMHIAGRPLSWEVIFVGYYALLAVSVLPLRGFMDFGVWEGSWTVILVYFGTPMAEAVEISLVSHLVHIVILCIFGGGPLIYFLKNKNNLVNSQV